MFCKPKYFLLVAQSCLTLCDPTDCSPPGSSVHRILQARTLEWAAMASSRGFSSARDRTRISYVSCNGSWVPYHSHHVGSPLLALSYLKSSSGFSHDILQKNSKELFSQPNISSKNQNETKNTSSTQTRRLAELKYPVSRLERSVF